MYNFKVEASSKVPQFDGIRYRRKKLETILDGGGAPSGSDVGMYQRDMISYQNDIDSRMKRTKNTKTKDSAKREIVTWFIENWYLDVTDPNIKWLKVMHGKLVNSLSAPSKISDTITRQGRVDDKSINLEDSLVPIRMDRDMDTINKDYREMLVALYEVGVALAGSRSEPTNIMVILYTLLIDQHNKRDGNNSDKRKVNSNKNLSSTILKAELQDTLSNNAIFTKTLRDVSVGSVNNVLEEKTKSTLESYLISDRTKYTSIPKTIDEFLENVYLFFKETLKDDILSGKIIEDEIRNGSFSIVMDTLKKRHGIGKFEDIDFDDIEVIQYTDNMIEKEIEKMNKKYPASKFKPEFIMKTEDWENWLEYSSEDMENEMGIPVANLLVPDSELKKLEEVKGVQKEWIDTELLTMMYQHHMACVTEEENYSSVYSKICGNRISNLERDMGNEMILKEIRNEMPTAGTNGYVRLEGLSQIVTSHFNLRERLTEYSSIKRIETSEVAKKYLNMHIKIIIDKLAEQLYNSRIQYNLPYRELGGKAENVIRQYAKEIRDTLTISNGLITILGNPIPLYDKGMTGFGLDQRTSDVLKTYEDGDIKDRKVNLILITSDYKLISRDRISTPVIVNKRNAHIALDKERLEKEPHINDITYTNIGNYAVDIITEDKLNEVEEDEIQNEIIKEMVLKSKHNFGF